MKENHGHWLSNESIQNNIELGLIWSNICMYLTDVVFQEGPYMLQQCQQGYRCSTGHQTCCAFKALGMLLKRKKQLKFKIKQIGGKFFGFKTTVTDLFDSQRPTECSKSRCHRLFFCHRPTVLLLNCIQSDMFLYLVAAGWIVSTISWSRLLWL